MKTKLMNRSGNVALWVLLLVATAGLGSCQRSVPPVPQSNRRVVEPKGSTDITKPWNHLNKVEGDAVLGPLSEMRR